MIEWTVIIQIDRMNHRQLMRFTLYKVYKKICYFVPSILFSLRKQFEIYLLYTRVFGVKISVTYITPNFVKCQFGDREHIFMHRENIKVFNV